MSEKVKGAGDGWRRFVALPFFGSEGEGEADPQVPPVGTTAQTEATNTVTSATTSLPKSYTQAEVDAMVSESKGYRKRAQDAEKKLSELEAKDLSELERAKAEAAAASTERDGLISALRTERFQKEVLREASVAKFLDPGDAVSLISMEDIKLDEDGKPDSTSLKAAIKRLVEAKPYLIGNTGTGSGDGGTRGGTTPDKAVDYEQEYQARGMVPIPG